MPTHIETQQFDSVPEVRSLVDSAQTGTRARLSLVKSDVSFLCNRNNLSAESPRGSRVRPFSISLRAVADIPASVPISENDNPVARISEIRSAHKIFMDTIVRDSGHLSKRKTVRELHDNSEMTRPANLPKCDTIGKRVRWWRKHRGFNNLREFAELLGIPKTTLSDLETGRTHTGTQLHLIAAKLGLNPHYLETDEGEPESSSPQLPPPSEPDWPFKEISPASLAGLNHIEKSYAEQQLSKALAEIEKARRQAKRTG